MGRHHGGRGEGCLPGAHVNHPYLRGSGKVGSGSSGRYFEKGGGDQQRASGFEQRVARSILLIEEYT
jgi:hypothetical protein